MNQYKEKCLISLVTRDIQIRTTMRYNFTPVRMAITKNAKKKNAGEGCRERRTHTLLMGR
jgi:hypothetical protein